MKVKQDWIYQFGSAEDVASRALTSDRVGNIYIAGFTRGGKETGAAQGGMNAWLAKLSADGTEQWRQQFGSALADDAHALTSDGLGNVYIAGYTWGELTIGEAQGGMDAWLAKFSADGTELWRRQFGSASNDYAYALTGDTLGNVYVAGSTAGELEAGEAQGGIDAWLAKFSADGTELWRRQFGSASNDYAYALTSDKLSNVYIAGSTAGELNVDAAQGGTDAWLAKFSADGTELWRYQFGSTSHDYAQALTTDGLGSIYVAGYTAGELKAGAAQGAEDAWLAKFSANGAEMWRHQFGSSLDDNAKALASDGLGNVYVAGSTAREQSGSSQSAEDAWLAKFSANGVEMWRHQFEATLNDARALTSDGLGNVYVTGSTAKDLLSSSPGSPDIWLAKFYEEPETIGELNDLQRCRHQSLVWLLQK